MKPFEETLASASHAWVETGLITASQRAAILARHPIAAATSSPNRFLGILASIGGALFVVGVSLVIKANWDSIGDWVKIGGLVALLAGSYVAGWRMKISPGHFPRLGDACFMMGSALFLLGIALVSQIFHLDSRPSNGVLLWWVGIAAVPWLMHAKGTQLLSIAAGLTWLGMELEARDSWLRLTVPMERWSENSFYHLIAAGFLVAAGVLFFGTSLRRGRYADFAGLHEILGLCAMGATLYALGFTWSVHSWHHHTMQAARWQPVVVIAVAVIAVAAWAFARNREGARQIFWFGLAGLVPVAAHLLGIELTDSGWLWGALSCVGLFLLNLGMIRVGLAEGRETWINLGMAGIALNVVTRYFLLFGTMLEGGVFFIVTGLLVLGLGYGLERKRRSLVGEVRKEAVS
jgi:uncharacterized membrane protein